LQDKTPHSYAATAIQERKGKEMKTSKKNFKILNGEICYRLKTVNCPECGRTITRSLGKTERAISCPKKSCKGRIVIGKE